MQDLLTAIAWSLLPTVVVLGLFVWVVRSMLRMDRTERRIHDRIEAEERARRGLPPRGSGTGEPSTTR